MSEIARVRDLIDSVIADEDWKKIFANLLKIATSDQGHAAVAAAQVLARYRWGVPVQQEPEEDRPFGPIQYIEVDPVPNVRDDAPLAEGDDFSEPPKYNAGANNSRRVAS